jgi:hypothetical protein
LLGGARIQLVNMDAPYNVKVEPRSNNAIAAGLSSFSTTTPKSAHHQGLDLARHPGKAKKTHDKLRPKDRPLANDFVSDEEFDRLLRAWFANAANALEPGRAFYAWGGYANLANYPSALKESGLYFSQAIVWDKCHPVLTRKDFMGAFELAFYGWKEGAAHTFLGPNDATDLWEVKKLNHTQATVRATCTGAPSPQSNGQLIAHMGVRRRIIARGEPEILHIEYALVRCRKVEGKSRRSQRGFPPRHRP